MAEVVKNSVHRVAYMQRYFRALMKQSPKWLFLKMVCIMGCLNITKLSVIFIFTLSHAGARAFLWRFWRVETSSRVIGRRSVKSKRTTPRLVKVSHACQGKQPTRNSLTDSRFVGKQPLGNTSRLGTKKKLIFMISDISFWKPAEFDKAYNMRTSGQTCRKSHSSSCTALFTLVKKINVANINNCYGWLCIAKYKTWHSCFDFRIR